MLDRFDRRTGDANEWLRVGPMKFFVDPARTMETEVDLTVLGGRVVYER